eukprot:GILJ01005902.1.p1 GENE.GILJ01005902.1~~GILJ01005902.1.p1  ORF type:complete len:149 (-),score=12.25 GILJ01005902.1:277-723(-)
MDSSRPWTNEEHDRFLDGLERYGSGTSGREWQQICEHMGSERTPDEVRLHAHRYFMKLQHDMVTKKGHGKEPQSPVTWTYEEDQIFENALAEYEEGTSDRWHRIAALLPAKTSDQVIRRYQRLLLDVAKIEAEEDILVSYVKPTVLES